MLVSVICTFGIPITGISRKWDMDHANKLYCGGVVDGLLSTRGWGAGDVPSARRRCQLFRLSREGVIRPGNGFRFDLALSAPIRIQWVIYREGRCVERIGGHGVKYTRIFVLGTANDCSQPLCELHVPS